MLVLFALLPLVVQEVWVVRASIGVVLGLLVFQGMLQHKRTDELISGQYRLARLSEGLEREVQVRTAKLREANAALARANLDLAEAAQAQEQMLLDVSHDLRTPMTSVKGAAQNLLDGIAGELSSVQRDYVEIVRDHAERLVRVISELLERARQPAMKVELKLARFNLADLVSDVVRGLRLMAEDKGVKLVCDGASVSCVGDAAKLRNVFENLIGNAIKYTEPGGEVRIALEQREHELLVVVRDNGAGMSEPLAARAFERFFRASDQPGTGLGLAITRDLVRLHRGEITLKSQLGMGSEFSISLPEGSA